MTDRKTIWECILPFEWLKSTKIKSVENCNGCFRPQIYDLCITNIHTLFQFFLFMFSYYLVKWFRLIASDLSNNSKSNRCRKGAILDGWPSDHLRILFAILKGKIKLKLLQHFSLKNLWKLLMVDLEHRCLIYVGPLISL